MKRNNNLCPQLLTVPAGFCPQEGKNQPPLGNYVKKILYILVQWKIKIISKPHMDSWICSLDQNIAIRFYINYKYEKKKTKLNGYSVFIYNHGYTVFKHTVAIIHLFENESYVQCR